MLVFPTPPLPLVTAMTRTEESAEGSGCRDPLRGAPFFRTFSVSFVIFLKASA